MQGHVGIGMADEAPVVGNRHAAQRHAAARSEAMDIETVADAQRPGKQAFGEGQILFRGDLEVVGGAFDSDHAQARPFGDGGVVGKVGFRNGAVSGKDIVEAEGLRRSRAPQGLAGNGLDDGLAGEALEGVADGGRRHRSGVGVQRGEGARDGVGVDERARGVVNRDAARRTGGERFQAEADRALPRRPAERRFGKIEAGRSVVVERPVVAMDHRLDAVDRRMFEKCAQAALQHGAPAQEAILLGRAGSEPPAATGGHDERDRVGAAVRRRRGHGRGCRDVGAGGSSRPARSPSYALSTACGPCPPPRP